MADPKRLGRREAYRLGQLRAPDSPPPRRPAPFAPSFASRPPRGSFVRWLVACAVAAALLGAGAKFGLWFLPFVAGLAAGAARWRGRSVLAFVVVAVAVGWGAALWWPTLTGAPEGATARAVAALAGLPPYAGVGVTGTLLVGIGQGLVAAWFARAVTYRLR
jgi:branched-subunit amino acid transport protein